MAHERNGRIDASAQPISDQIGLLVVVELHRPGGGAMVGQIRQHAGGQIADGLRDTREITALAEKAVQENQGLPPISDGGLVQFH